MREQRSTMAAVSRAGRRAAFHLLRAAVESLKAVEAVIDEMAGIGEESREDDRTSSTRQRIEVE